MSEVYYRFQTDFIKLYICFIYFFILTRGQIFIAFRETGREGKRERNINWLPSHMHPKRSGNPQPECVP